MFCVVLLRYRASESRIIGREGETECSMRWCLFQNSSPGVFRVGGRGIYSAAL